MDASEYYCSYLVSFWGVLPIFRGKLLFLSFSMLQCTRKWQLTWDTQTLFVSAAPFFFLAMGAAWKIRWKKRWIQRVKWSEEYQNLRSKRLLSVLNDLNGHMQRQDGRPSKHQKSYWPSFGLSVRANGTSPVKFTKLQVLHTCTKKTQRS